MKNRKKIDYSKEHLEYLNAIKRKDAFVSLMRYAIIVVFIFFWEISAETGLSDPFISSSPSRFIVSIINLYNEGVLFSHIGITLFETVVGFVVGTILGTLIAILLWWSNTLSKILDPYLVVLNALPKIALGPILIVWFGAGVGSIIIMGLLISLIVTVMSVLSGFMEITDEKQFLMKTLGASKKQILTMVVLPASIPTIMNALKLSVGMSWVGVIVGEYLVSKSGLGYLIVYGGQVFKLDLVMASIVILCILAALMYYAVAYFEKRLVKWRTHE